jgi:transcriptional regulator with XRE-family HTH domain
MMRIGPVIRRWRMVTGASLREIALQVGIPAGTLARVERGDRIAGETLASVVRWILSEMPESQETVPVLNSPRAAAVAAAAEEKQKLDELLQSIGSP